jgi:hypothetical protein
VVPEFLNVDPTLRLPSEITVSTTHHLYGAGIALGYIRAEELEQRVLFL